MSCFPELTYEIHADGELQAEEAGRVEAHLASCSACRTLMEELRGENALLASALQEAPGPAAAPARSHGFLRVAAGAVAAVAAVRALVGGVIPELPLPEWFHPLSLFNGIGLLFEGVFRFVEGGFVMIESHVHTIQSLVLLAIVIGGAIWLVRTRPAPVVGMIGLCLLLALPTGASAAFVTRTDQIVTIPADETVEGTLIVTADTVAVEGVVNGDLIVMSRDLDLPGTVHGNLYVFTRNLDLEGQVDGAIHGFAQSMRVHGEVGGNSYMFAQFFQQGAGGKLARDVALFAEKATFDGELGRDAAFFIATMTLNGKVGRDVSASTDSGHVSGEIGGHLDMCGDRLTLTPTAHVGGDVTACVPKKQNLQVMPGATVLGQTTAYEPSATEKGTAVTKKEHWVLALVGWVWKVLFRILKAFLVGIVLYLLFPALFRRGLASGMEAVVGLGIGFLVLVGIFFGGLVIMVTLVGLPLGMIAWTLLGVGLYLAKLFVAAALGGILVPTASRSAWMFALQLAIGLAIVIFLIHLPWIGFWLRMLVWLMGLGLLSMRLWALRGSPEPAPATTAAAAS